MGSFAYNIISYPNSISSHTHEITRTHHFVSQRSTLVRKPINFGLSNSYLGPLCVSENEEATAEEAGAGEDRTSFRWVNIGCDVSETQKRAISELPPKMAKRCQALLKQIICFSPEKGTVYELLAMWVKLMKPTRAHWLAVLKELRKLEHPMLFQVAEIALLEESFEANIRDYTSIIHGYAKQNRLHDAENTLSAMKKRGFMCDQVTLTALVHMYSKAGNLKLAEDTFEEMRLLGVPLDKRSYGSMIMAYVRAGLLELGEGLLKEAEAQETYAGREVYKALLRAYSMVGDSEGAQRVFNATQFACIIPDVKMCGLLINAYLVAGKSDKAFVAFENLKRAGLEPNDKCIALVLSAYEKEEKLNCALKFLMDLERDGVMVGKEASEVLVGWFRRLGVVEEVGLVLKEFAASAM